MYLFFTLQNFYQYRQWPSLSFKNDGGILNLIGNTRKDESHHIYFKINEVIKILTYLSN